MRRLHPAVLLAPALLAALLTLNHVRDTRHMQAAAMTLFGKVIVLDPGHGGPDPGAVGRSGSLEKDIVLAIAGQLRSFLESVGAEVILTREDDRDLSGLDNGSLRQRKRLDLAARVEIGNQPGVDLFLSIHANKIPSGRWFGAQTFYFRDGHPESARLATAIQTELVRVTRRTTRVASSRIDQYLLENLLCPAATVEVGFLSNASEEAVLITDAYQTKVAWAIFMGVARYMAGGR